MNPLKFFIYCNFHWMKNCCCRTSYAYEKERLGYCDFSSSTVVHRMRRDASSCARTASGRSVGPATHASPGSRGGSTAACSAYRSDCRHARAGLLLGSWLLGLERKMGLGRWCLASASLSTCCVGRTSLGPSWSRIRLGPRLLALSVAVQGVCPSRAQQRGNQLRLRLFEGMAELPRPRPGALRPAQKHRLQFRRILLACCRLNGSERSSAW